MVTVTRDASPKAAAQRTADMRLVYDNHQCDNQYVEIIYTKKYLTFQTVRCI